MMNRLAIVVATVLGLAVSAPLLAHHGGTTLYDDTTIELEGTVKAWYWANPHVLLTITVDDDSGQPVDWIFEMQAPNTIRPLGFRKDLLAAGDAVKVQLQPAKNGNHNGRLTHLVLPDGTELDPQAFRNGTGGRGDERP